MIKRLEGIPMETIVKETELILVEARDRFLYENGQRTNQRDGTAYSVISYALGGEKIVVVVNENTISVPQEQVDRAIEGGTPLKVSFKNAMATIYSDFRSSSIGLSVRADSITVASAEKPIRREVT